MKEVYVSSAEDYHGCLERIHTENLAITQIRLTTTDIPVPGIELIPIAVHPSHSKET